MISNMIFENNESLFVQKEKNNFIPLAEKMRPTELSFFVGQDEVIGENSILRKMIETDRYSSFILWGPPGSGKTTIARIIFNKTALFCKTVSAVTQGIKETKEIMEEANKNLNLYGKQTILFVDEIHRFNKAQQDAFLPYVENGTIVLIGATTENPSFSIISPLLSRMRVFALKRLNDFDIVKLLKSAIDKLSNEDTNIEIEDSFLEIIAKVASGDARRAYGILEIAINLAKNENDKGIKIDNEILKKALIGRMSSYDKKYDYHYDYISALHKSMRNSDPDAAIYYTVKMLESGEDPLYIMRRVIQHSSEDVGLADPNALIISIAARDAVMALGMPEAKLAILEAVVYNALAAKSNSLLLAYSEAEKDIKENPDIPVPLHLRNPVTKLMQNSGYGNGYSYAHNEKNAITNMTCLPDELKNKEYYKPKDFGFEKKLKEILSKIKNIKKS